MLLVRFQPVARPLAHRCHLDQEGPHWMVLTPRLWDSRTGARHRLTRTNCTSSELRSWPIRCWPGGSPCLTTCRWRCRASGRCLGCSSRCQHYLHPLCLQQDPALALGLALGLARDQHLQITAGPTVRPTIASPWGREGSLSTLTKWGQQCQADLLVTGFPLGLTQHLVLRVLRQAGKAPVKVNVLSPPLAGVAQWIEVISNLADQRVSSLIPSLGHMPG